MTDPWTSTNFLTDELYFFRPLRSSRYGKGRRKNRTSQTKYQERIAVCGDYDADGVTASAILYTYLKDNGYDVVCSIPKRLESGYGLHNDTVDELHKSGVSLL